MARTGLAVFIGVLLVAGPVGGVTADDKVFVYHQSTGKLTLDGKEFASGYSGKGEGKNNPEKEREKNVGPIPRGRYKIGKAKEWKGMKYVFELSPDGHDARDRSHFLIHGDSKRNPGNASEGCIILPPAIRKKIAESGITSLLVVKD